MAELPNLDIDLNTHGWNKTGGKSYNVWGTVPFPQDLLDIMNNSNSNRSIFKKISSMLGIKFNPKSPIWTAYDPIIYGATKPLTVEDLPRISATFKSCFAPYSAVVENMLMKIAYELDVPTSWNYIVKFDKDKYTKITDLYNITSNMKKLEPVGIVSIDFLQPSHKNVVAVTKSVHKNFAGEKEIDYIDSVGGDILVSFEDAFKLYMPHLDKRTGEQNLLKNWIYVAKQYIKDKLPQMLRDINPKISDKDIEEKVAKTTKKVCNRIAKSCVFKEFAGDVDSTDYNGGFVINEDTGRIRFAATHDYGEACSALIKNKLIPHDAYCGMSKEAFNALPQNVQDLMLANNRKKHDISINEIAQMYASGSISEQNLQYAFEHFPDACDELFRNLDLAIQGNKLDAIVEQYNNLTIDEKPLLTTEEVKIFQEYLDSRASWICELYAVYLQKNNKPIPQFTRNDLKNLD